MAAHPQRGLREEGAVVDVVHEGEDAVWSRRTRRTTPSSSTSCCPGIDGFEVCRRCAPTASGRPS